MKIFSFVFLMFFYCQAVAADAPFDARVAYAKVVEETPAGKAYQQSFFKAVGEDLASIMQECFPNATVDTTSFTLVADVLPNQTLAKGVIQPITPMTQCFIGRFARLPFPKPPASFGNTGMPLVMEIRITP